jgi:hypothetical protein
MTPKKRCCAFQSTGLLQQEEKDPLVIWLVVLGKGKTPAMGVVVRSVSRKSVLLRAVWRFVEQFLSWCVCQKMCFKVAPVARTCNPSYSEGIDQEDCSSKPALANSSGDIILIKPKWLKQ